MATIGRAPLMCDDSDELVLTRIKSLVVPSVENFVVLEYSQPLQLSLSRRTHQPLACMVEHLHHFLFHFLSVLVHLDIFILLDSTVSRGIHLSLSLFFEQPALIKGLFELVRAKIIDIQVFGESDILEDLGFTGFSS